MTQKEHIIYEILIEPIIQVCEKRTTCADCPYHICCDNFIHTIIPARFTMQQIEREIQHIIKGLN